MARYNLKGYRMDLNNYNSCMYVVFAIAKDDRKRT